MLYKLMLHVLYDIDVHSRSDNDNLTGIYFLTYHMYNATRYYLTMI